MLNEQYSIKIHEKIVSTKTSIHDNVPWYRIQDINVIYLGNYNHSINKNVR